MFRTAQSLILSLLLASVSGKADEIFLGGKDFFLSGERTGNGSEVQSFLPHGEDERNWKERIEIHNYPDLQQPRRVILAFLDRLREIHPDTTYRILPEPAEDRAGVSYLLVSPGEVRLEYLLYEETAEAPGLMAYRYIHRSTGPEARYSKSLLRGKWDYYQRAFLEVDWPQSLNSVAVPEPTALFSMGRAEGVPLEASDERVEMRSLTVPAPEGKTLRVDGAFMESQGIETDAPYFSFSVPRATENLFVEYQGEGVPEVLKLSLAAEDLQLAENLRVFPFIVPVAEGDGLLLRTAVKLRRKIEEEYLDGWDDVRVGDPFLTLIGDRDSLVCLASFADPQGNRLFARFTLILPDTGVRGLLVFSQVDPRFSVVKRLEDLESGGVMARIAHSIRLIGSEEELAPAVPLEPEAERSSSLPYDPIYD